MYGKHLLLLGASVTSVYAGHNIKGEIITKLGNDVPIDEPNQYWSQLHACPLPCEDKPSSEWTAYSSLDETARCTEPMLMELNIYNSIINGKSIRYRACTTTAHNDDKPMYNTQAKDVFKPQVKRAEQHTCLGDVENKSAPLQIVKSSSTSGSAESTLEGIKSLQQKINHGDGCDSTILFASHNKTIAGIYAGQSISRSSIADWLSKLTADVTENGNADRMVAQTCGKPRDSAYAIGLSINTKGDLGAVQKDLRTWTDGKCVNAQGSKSMASISLQQSKITSSGDNKHQPRWLDARADCRTITVNAGDGCWALAQRCGISQQTLESYNPAKDFCNTLQPGQKVCCSKGTLPNNRPKPNPDGSCAVYTIKSGDGCSKIAAQYSLTLADLAKFNDGTTWGWTGCDLLYIGVNICVSTGTPPLPAPVSNAVCGPTKPGTKKPTDGTKIEDLNPCPLNACCNKWGQCGITPEFCTVSKGPTGNPGTSAPGVNGCVSSCGTSIVKGTTAPASFGRVGYYESWNMDRKCLRMKVSDANPGGYNIIHWAFAEINTADWTVRINDPHGQWASFKALKDVKKVVSFGGWGYSTDSTTYNILRDAISPVNRDAFSTNVADFIAKEGLDGVDLDWEYPGADVSGAPAGKPDDGVNYLKFLGTLKGKLTTAQTLSIAAPASFFYLKNFPIQAISAHLDYIVYMTYDLHGQWDAGSPWSNDGCLGGNCLRSHVNMTETYYALAMITKAKVPANKIFVGESSYGRSFKMAKAGCDGPDCFFLGDANNSQAAKGRCTDTAGYLADAEIEEIIKNNKNAKSFHDANSGADVLVYNDTEWVGYMTNSTKNLRRNVWKNLNFAGSIDWALDLQRFTDADNQA